MGFVTDMVGKIRGNYTSPAGDKPFVEMDEMIDKATSGDAVDTIDTSPSTFEIDSEIPEPEIPRKSISDEAPVDYQSRKEWKDQFTNKEEVTAEIPPPESTLEKPEESYVEINPEEIVDIDTVVSKGKPSRRAGSEELSPLPWTPEIGKPESDQKQEVSLKPKDQEVTIEKETVKSKSGKEVESALFGKWFDKATGYFNGKTSGDDIENARKGGYFGKDSGTLDSENKTLQDQIDDYEIEISKINKELKEKRIKFEVLDVKRRKGTASEDELRDYYTLKDDIETLSMRKQVLDKKIESSKRRIISNNENIEKFNRAVAAGREIKRKEPSSWRKHAESLGKGASTTLTTDLYRGAKGPGLMKGEWFGARGFLSYPFKEKRLEMTGVIPPVKSGSAALSGYTRATGQSVRGGIGESLTRVNPSKMISPFGVPIGKPPVSTAFEHTIPARAIPLSQINKANINPAILPSVYDVRIPQPPTPQMPAPVQETTTQFRKRKIATVSVNRLNTGQFDLYAKMKSENSLVIPSGPKITPDTKRDKLISRGISSVGNLKSLKIKQLSLGSKRALQDVTISKRHEPDLGLLSVVKDDIKIEERKSKKSKINVDFTISQRICKNIKKTINK